MDQVNTIVFQGQAAGILGNVDIFGVVAVQAHPLPRLAQGWEGDIHSDQARRPREMRKTHDVVTGAAAIIQNHLVVVTGDRHQLNVPEVLAISPIQVGKRLFSGIEVMVASDVALSPIVFGTLRAGQSGSKSNKNSFQDVLDRDRDQTLDRI